MVFMTNASQKFFYSFVFICLFFIIPAVYADDILKIPSNLKRIEDNYFAGTAMSDVELPDGLKSIGSRAFADTGLQSIYIPDSVTEISSNAFDGCDDLKIIVEPGSFAEKWCENNGLASWRNINLGVKKHTKNEILKFIAEHPAETALTTDYRRKPAVDPYVTGLLTTESKQNALNMVNQIRYIVGLNANVVLSPDHEEMLAAASMINALNNSLSHYPSRPNELRGSRYDDIFNLGREGASISNLAAYYSDSYWSDIILLYMYDSDWTNIDRVGHRRWILNPPMGKTMFSSYYHADVNYWNFTAMYALDRSGTGNEAPVAWPAMMTPASYFIDSDTHAWSVSFGYQIGIDDIQVKLTRVKDGKEWNFSSSGSDGIFFVNNDGYGQKGCVIFQPDGIGEVKGGDIFEVSISNKSKNTILKYTVTFFDFDPIRILNSSGKDITGTTVTVNTSSYQLKAVNSPAGTAQKVTWSSSNKGVATVNADGKVTFKKAGSVKITATTMDSSKKSVSVTLNFQLKKPALEIKDTNIRGKNKEIQIVIPWTSDLSRVECTLYDDSSGKQVKPTFRERMDSTGKNKVVSYVGAPLENGKVYRFKIRVYNGQWSNYVEKYAMPISNVYGATVVAGNKTMYINTQHREPATGTRYMVFDAATQRELAYKAGTKTNTSWKYDKLTNGKLYYVVAVPYRDYKGQRLWGPNENRIYFIPMAVPSNGKVSFSGSNATVSITADSSVNGICVLYRTVGGALKNGCKANGAKCTIKGLNSSTAYEFYVMKYKISGGKTYYSTGTLIPYKTKASGLTAPQMNPVVAMNNSGYTTFTIKKSSNAEGISVLYKIGSENFVQACEKAGNTCSTTLNTSKNYTFYIMQYRTQNGKKVYSPGIVARDFSSMKNGEFDRMYTGFTLADETIDMNEVYDALDGYTSEENLLLAEALAVMGEDPVSKGANEFDSDTFYEDDGFDYSNFDAEAPHGEFEADDFEADAFASYDPDDTVYEPYDESVDGIDWENEPETGIEEPIDDGDESEESEGLSMYYFGGSDKTLPTAPSFNNL